MPNLFPQVNANAITTQLPYVNGIAFQTIVQDVEVGIRFSYPLRGVGLTGFPTGPLGKFGVNYSQITDAEVASLLSFFESMKGRKTAFRFLDPGGNLITFSEDFSQSDWDKSNGPVTITGPTIDPFGGNRATALVGGGSNAYIKIPVGPTDGGMSGVVVCGSVWVKTPDIGARLQIGFLNSTFSIYDNTDFPLPQNSWVRIFHTFKITDNNEWFLAIGGNAEWAGGRTMNMFGAMVAPTKGEGAYVKTPGNYGYHQYCRFDTDVFQRQVLGPNQNSLVLPIVEINAPGIPPVQLGTNQVGSKDSTPSTSAVVLTNPDTVQVNLQVTHNILVGYSAFEAIYGGTGHLFDDLYLDGVFVTEFDSGVLPNSGSVYTPTAISWTFTLVGVLPGVHTIEVRHRVGAFSGSWADRILTTGLV